MEEQIITPSDGTQARLLGSGPPRQWPPRRDAPRLVRVGAHQEHLQLMRLQLLDGTVGRPVWELPLRQTLMADPKSLTIVGQNLDRRAPPIAEHHQPAAERIHLELRPADPRQAVDAGAKVDARHRHEDPHLRSELDHEAPQPERQSCNTTSAAAPGAISSVSR